MGIFRQIERVEGEEIKERVKMKKTKRNGAKGKKKPE